MTPDDDWAERFLARLDQSGDCWDWLGTQARGYGVLGVGGTQMLAHRVSYLLHNGDLPDGSFICHHCDNRACCRPDHLYAGDVRTNSDDAVARGRLRPARGEAQGHAVLTTFAIKAIRTEYASGATSQARLAVKYGVSSSNIGKIVNYQSWRHVRVERQ